MQLPSNTPPAAHPEALLKHFAATYFSLRRGLALLAFAFPIVLYGWGKFRHGLDLQPSMSAYFWAARAGDCAAYPMRTVFVGFLFAIGTGLYLYKGLTAVENYALNAAGVCAAVVALFPGPIAAAGEGARCVWLVSTLADLGGPAGHAAPGWPWVHYGAAVALFALLAFIAWFCAGKSLQYLPEGKDPAAFRRTYRGIAVGMLLFPVPGAAVAFATGQGANWLFFVEAAGILTFGLYWATKTRELRLSHPEEDPSAAAERAMRRQSPAAATEALSGDL